MRRLALTIVLAVMVGCGRSSPPVLSDIKSAVKVPQRLIFESEISGRVLAYELKRPCGVAVGPLGELYIADSGNNRLIKLDGQLNPVRDYGSYGEGIGRFHNPEDLVIDRGLTLYVVDASNRRIVLMNMDLNYVGEIIPQDAPNEILSSQGRLSGVAISPLGEVTVADYDNSRLIRMDNFGRFSRYVGDFGYGKGALLNPLGLATDKAGRCYVADGANGRIVVYDDFGNYLFEFGGGDLKRPSAVAVSPQGAIWVGDRDTDELFAFTNDGRLLFHTGSTGQEEGQFSDIEALAIASDGSLYVADAGNNRILHLSIEYEENQ